VEIIGETAAKMNLNNVLIGHHDPKRTDDEIDEMVKVAQQHYEGALPEASENPEKSRIVAGADRMMLFIPSKERNRKGIVYGRMNLHKGVECSDEIGLQSSVVSQYKSFDLTQTYNLDDCTTEG